MNWRLPFKRQCDGFRWTFGDWQCLKNRMEKINQLHSFEKFVIVATFIYNKDP